MALLGNSSKNINGVITPSRIIVGTSGDTLTFNANTAQELVMFNNSASAVVVTVSGSTATTVGVPNAGSATFSLAAGFTVSVPANGFSVVPLDKHTAFLQGTVSIVAATGAVVTACILQ